jgi:hypothetical protein
MAVDAKPSRTIERRTKRHRCGKFKKTSHFVYRTASMKGGRRKVVARICAVRYRLAGCNCSLWTKAAGMEKAASELSLSGSGFRQTVNT